MRLITPTIPQYLQQSQEERAESTSIEFKETVMGNTQGKNVTKRKSSVSYTHTCQEIHPGKPLDQFPMVWQISWHNPPIWPERKWQWLQLHKTKTIAKKWWTIQIQIHIKTNSQTNTPNKQDWSRTQRNQTRNPQTDRNNSRPLRDQSNNIFGQMSWSNTRSRHNPKQRNQANAQAYRDYNEYSRDQIARVTKKWDEQKQLLLINKKMYI